MAEKLVPKDRAEWLTFRQQDVTASDIGCLLDPTHPWCTPYKLWAEKTGKIAPEDLDSAVLRRGKKLERLGAEETQERLPKATIEHNKDNAYWRDPGLRIGATPDLIVHDSERGLGVVELKNPGVGTFARKWFYGEPPLFTALQVITAAKLVGAQWAAVGALRVDDHTYDFDLIDIPLADGVWTQLTQAVHDFWECVTLDQPPTPSSKLDLAVVQDIYPVSRGSTIDLSGDNELIHALAEREQSKKTATIMQDDCDRWDALIRHKAGDNELIIAGDYRITLRTEQVKQYTVAAKTRRPIRIKRIRGEAAA